MMPSQQTRILIVEDNLNMQSFIYKTIFDLRENMVVHFVSNGEDALTYLDRTRPNLVITDLLMPRLNGIDLMRKVRDEHGLEYVRFMLVTGGLTTDVGMCEADIKSMFGCIIVRKPFRPAFLRATVNSLLEEVENEQVGS